jgi:branched-chain amino acid transport system ATP-binding protein
VAEPMLEVRGLRVGYGRGRDVLRDVDLTVGAGEFVSVLGPNGAGKSTLMNALAGRLPVSAGSIHFAGEDITRLRPGDRVDRGLQLALEGHRVVAELTVADNLRLAVFRVPRRFRRREVETRLADVYERFAVLAKFRDKPAGMLSGGEQQMVVIGRLLMGRPRLLLLDEPSLGLAPVFVQQVYRELAAFQDDERSILLVEQNVQAALELSDRAYVLSLGAITAGRGAREWSQRDLIGSYLRGSATIADS